jgi:rhodanese-related sulfurtransferase
MFGSSSGVPYSHQATARSASKTSAAWLVPLLDAALLERAVALDRVVLLGVLAEEPGAPTAVPDAVVALRPVGRTSPRYRRDVPSTDGSAISRLLEECRRELDRVEPADLAAAQAAGALVVDIRPLEQRRRDGELPGAVVIDRNVLEWRLDPSSPDRLALADDPDRRIVVVCDEGYSSSLAARTLQLLGLANATDLRGGHQAWRSICSSSSSRSPMP